MRRSRVMRRRAAPARGSATATAASRLASAWRMGLSLGAGAPAGQEGRSPQRRRDTEDEERVLYSDLCGPLLRSLCLCGERPLRRPCTALPTTAWLLADARVAAGLRERLLRLGHVLAGHEGVDRVGVGLRPAVLGRRAVLDARDDGVLLPVLDRRLQVGVIVALPG